MKKLVATLGILTFLVGTGIAQEKKECTGAPEGRKFEKRAHHERLMDEIPDLTEQQKAEIKAIKQETRKKTEPQRAELKTIQSKIAELKMAENPNQQEINKLIDKSALMKADMEKSRAASEMKVRGVLTPEQQKVMNEKMKIHMQQKEKRHMEHKQMREAK
jgi:Spy/CpxP family protein refolding chaperone